MENLAPVYGTGFIFIAILLIILAVLAILMPFFVLKIRNETISINKKLSTIITLLGGSEKTATSKLVKICPFCKTKNRAFDYVCINCGKEMGL